MNKQQAIDFLTSEGLLTDVDEFGDDKAFVSFKSRGTVIHLITDENDPLFLFLKCGYQLEAAERDELFVLRTLRKLQENYKVAKIGYDVDRSSVYATAEQFVPDGPDFASIFWRTVSLVSSAASDACTEVNAIVSADMAASRFTSEIEAEIQSESG